MPVLALCLLIMGAVVGMISGCASVNRTVDSESGVGSVTVVETELSPLLNLLVSITFLQWFLTFLRPGRENWKGRCRMRLI